MKKLVLIVFVSLLAGCGDPTPTLKDKFPLPADYVPVYEVAAVEDLSYGNGTNLIPRQQYRVILPKGLSKEDIKLNLRHLAISKYDSDGVRNISILAYNNPKEINGSYTVAMYELCPYGDWELADNTSPDSEYAENFAINDAYYQSALYKPGEKIRLDTAEEYSKVKKQFVPASTTKVSTIPSNFNNENIKKVKNGTVGTITDVYTTTVGTGSLWIAYKIKFDNPSMSEGWVLEENLKKL